MSPAPAGWYDDPDDPERLRYWDGVVWTEHVTPKRPASIDLSHLAEAPAAPERRSERPQGRVPGPLGAVRVSRLPDGTALSGWWRRVGAFLIDAFLVNLCVTLIGLPFFEGQLAQVTQWWTDAAAALAAGRTPAPVPAEIGVQLGMISAGLALAHGLYDVVGLTRWGVTIGRLATGIRVRAADGAVRLPPSVALRRTGIKFIGDLVAPVPLLGTFGEVFTILDRLFPLWDAQRQSIHDKAAATHVILNPSRGRRIV